MKMRRKKVKSSRFFFLQAAGADEEARKRGGTEGRKEELNFKPPRRSRHAVMSECKLLVLLLDW